MPSENFTKATISKLDKKRLRALKQKLTMLANGAAVSEAEAIRWLLDQPAAQELLSEKTTPHN